MSGESRREIKKKTSVRKSLKWLECHDRLTGSSVDPPPKGTPQTIYNPIIIPLTYHPFLTLILRHPHIKIRRQNGIRWINRFVIQTPVLHIYFRQRYLSQIFMHLVKEVMVISKNPFLAFTVVLTIPGSDALRFISCSKALPNIWYVAATCAISWYCACFHIIIVIISHQLCVLMRFLGKVGAHDTNFKCCDCSCAALLTSTGFES